MHKYRSLIVSDVKNIKRDPTLLMLWVVPFILFLAIRLGLPVLQQWVPGSIPFTSAILGLFGLLNASFPGFIMAFMLLDEKDLKLLPVIKTTPVSLSGLLLIRLLFLSFSGLLTTFILLYYNGCQLFTLWGAVQLSLLCVLNAPPLLLLMATLARNKIEGLTFMKGANIVMILPVIVLLIEYPLRHLTAVLPAYWVYAWLQFPPHQNGLFLSGVLVLLLYNAVLFRVAIQQPLRT